MTITLSVPPSEPHLQPRITVIGVGGAGGNAVNNMIDSHLEGVEFISANTDAQALAQSVADRKIQLGHNITHGLGAGSRPDVGRAAAEEAIDDIAEHLQSAHMVFITAGMGGGTGTGAAPVIARMARDHGILTVGVVTKPFQFEGLNRMRIAEAGIDEMQQYADTLIVIPNQNLFRVANERTTFAEAFAMADQVLHSGVRGVTDLMVVPGLINLDFADIRAVMSEMGKAMMGTGEAEGDERARLAAEAAISNPLLDEVSMKGARGVLINITGGPDMTLFEVDEAANRIGDEVDSDSNIIFGSTMDPTFDGRMRVSVVATGIDVESTAQPKPVLTVYTRPTPVSDAPLARTGTDGDQARSAGMASASGGASLAVAAKPVAAKPVAAAPRPQDGKTPPAPGAVPDRPAPAVSAVADKKASAQPEIPEIVEPKTDPAETASDGSGDGGPVDDAAGDVFVAPPAVDSRSKTVAADLPDPFKEADMFNGGGDRRPSLFKRMTGTTRPRKESARPQPPEPDIPTVQPTPEIDGGPAGNAAPEQVRMDGVERRDGVKATRSEEDLLDIPAFLRRQAN